MKLLLFDIDGTLIHANGTGRATIERVLSDQFDRPITTEAVTFSGKTDPQIMTEILRVNGFGDEVPSSLVQTALTAYEQVASALLSPDHVNLLPGVSDLLDRLERQPDIQLGLLTGNIEAMAYRKLGAVGLDDYFPFGAFGSDHADRYQLPEVALRRAVNHTGHPFQGPDIVIIGDTHHDICCGRSIGARAIGVCTGRYARSELAAHEPDVLLDDLSDLHEFMRSVHSFA